MPPVNVTYLAKTKLRIQTPGVWFNIKILSYQYRNSHCGDKMILRLSNLHNGIFFTGRMTFFIIPPAKRSCWGVYIGFIPSVPPSVYPSVRLCVPPSCIPCPLCSSGWIHFNLYILSSIFRRCVSSIVGCKILKYGFFGNFLKFVTLTLSFLTWDLMWITSMGNHRAAGYLRTQAF